MKSLSSLLAIPLLAVGFAAGASNVDSPETSIPETSIQEHDFPLLSTLEQVDSIPALTRLHSWSVVDDDTLIVWTSPFEPYLVELFRPSRELKFAWSIGVTSFGSRIHARFDSVEVDGFSYPIREIYKLSRDDAEAWSERS
jgi:hypothetical protein